MSDPLGIAQTAMPDDDDALTVASAQRMAATLDAEADAVDGLAIADVWRDLADEIRATRFANQLVR